LSPIDKPNVLYQHNIVFLVTAKFGKLAIWHKRQCIGSSRKYNRIVLRIDRFDLWFFRLFVFLPPIAAQANIHGPPEVFVKKGSTISLTCSVNVHSTPPSSVVWLHGTKVVDFDSPRGRGGISLETEKTESGTTSRLLVTKAGLSDTGNYTCQPSNANTATVFVHVLNGKSKISSWRTY